MSFLSKKIPSKAVAWGTFIFASALMMVFLYVLAFITIGGGGSRAIAWFSFFPFGYFPRTFLMNAMYMPFLLPLRMLLSFVLTIYLYGMWFLQGMWWVSIITWVLSRSNEKIPKGLVVFSRRFVIIGLCVAVLGYLDRFTPSLLF